MRHSHAALVIRTTMSESTAFELGYMYSKFPNMPILIAVHNDSPIKTTLLQDLHPEVLSYIDRYFSKPWFLVCFLRANQPWFIAF